MEATALPTEPNHRPSEADVATQIFDNKLSGSHFNFSINVFMKLLKLIPSAIQIP